ncbi:MAG: hypothetical protein ACTSPQ_18375 [Candidatus Helarchaeota archaeon]
MSKIFKICKICGKKFNKSEKGRIRITIKEEKGYGEKVIYICPECKDCIKIKKS